MQQKPEDTRAAPLKVLAVADGMIPSVELVLRQPFELLQAQGHVDYALHVIADPTIPSSLAGYDALILMRVFQAEALALAQAAQLARVPVIYVIDDDFSALDPASPLGRHYRDNNAWQRILEICSLAASVWTFSQVLASRLSRSHAHVARLPAIANVELIDSLASESGTDIAPARIIGYAGQSTHAPDLASIAPAVAQVLDAHPDWSMEIVRVDAGTLAHHPRVRHHDGFNSVSAYYAWMTQRRWGIGLAPLLRNAVNDAKTDNKYREYAALRIPAVYSPSPPYVESVAHGITGLYAEGRDGWVRALETLMAAPETRGRIARNARRDVEVRYALATVAARYLEALKSALRPPARVLVVAPSDVPSVDIDIARPFARLQGEGLLDWQQREQEAVVDADLALNDCMVVVRYSDPLTVDLMQSAAVAHALPTVYSWDDDFLAIPDGLGALTAYYRAPRTVNALHRLLADATVVKASSERLAQRSRAYAQHVEVAAYGFDFGQFTGPGAIAADAEACVIGFFGSLSHGPTLVLLRSVLERIAEEFAHVRFEFFGPHVPQLASLPRATFLPWMRGAAESVNQLRNRGWDIGIAPLPDNPFNRAKLPTKFRDYGACGIAGIYARVEPYVDVVVDGETGMLVDEDAQSWHAAIRRLVVDPPLRQRIADGAYIHVRTLLDVEHAMTAWRRILEPLRPQPAVTTTSTSSATATAALRAADDSVQPDLQRQVWLLQTAARLLLLQRQQAETGKLGRLRRLVQRLKGSDDMSRYRSPAFAHFIPAPEVAEAARMRLQLSHDLQAHGPVDYAIPAAAAGCDVIEVALSLPIPTLPGLLTLEVVAADGTPVASASMSLERIDPFAPVALVLDRPLSAVAQGALRFSVRGALVPVHLFQVRTTASNQPVAFVACRRTEAA